MDRQKSIRRGFSLVEAAIVLGVVGLVIGSIWVGAANMYENYKIERVAKAIIIASQKLRENISAATIANTPRTGLGYAFLVDYCVNAKIFPDDFYSGNKIITPFDNNQLPDYTHANGGHINCVLKDEFIEIEINTPNKGICLKLSTAISSAFSNRTELESLSVYGYDNAPTVMYPGASNWPLSISGTHCNKIYPANIRLHFKPLRTN